MSNIWYIWHATGGGYPELLYEPNMEKYWRLWFIHIQANSSEKPSFGAEYAGWVRKVDQASGTVLNLKTYEEMMADVQQIKRDMEVDQLRQEQQDMQKYLYRHLDEQNSSSKRRGPPFTSGRPSSTGSGRRSAPSRNSSPTEPIPSSYQAES